MFLPASLRQNSRSSTITTASSDAPGVKTFDIPSEQFTKVNKNNFLLSHSFCFYLVVKY